jgi:hypothetical protein
MDLARTVPCTAGPTKESHYCLASMTGRGLQ